MVFLLLFFLSRRGVGDFSSLAGRTHLDLAKALIKLTVLRENLRHGKLVTVKEKINSDCFSTHPGQEEEESQESTDILQLMVSSRLHRGCISSLHQCRASADAE